MSVPLRVRVLRRIGAWLSRKTPLQRLSLAKRLAPIAARLASRRTRVARTNLRLCFPAMSAADQGALLQQSLVANVKGLLDACVAWYADELRVDQQYVVVGYEHLQQAIDLGQGVVILCGHFHGSELHMRAAAELTKGPVVPMVRSFNDPGLDQEINSRRRLGLGGVIERGDVQAFCAVVRRGGIVVYTPDVNVRTRNVFAPFFGVPASTLDAIPTILRRAGGAIVPASIKPLADGRYQLEFESLVRRPIAAGL